jgi:hypothetical protein
MEQGVRNPGLREAMQEHSKLSEHDPAELKAWDLIVDALGQVLEPGERVVAYADRDTDSNQIDAMAYESKGAAKVPDVMGYTPGGPKNETDAFDYDTDKGRSEPDVMGYEPGGPKNETDAFAYDHLPESPDNDAFMARGDVKPAEVDFLVLTDGRLVRGNVEGGDVYITDSPYEQPQVRVLADAYVAVLLPERICGVADGDWWCWQVPDGRSPADAATRWNRD